MGLYDTINFRISLPLPKDKALLDEFDGKPIEKLVTFQTKNLDRAMTSYTVNYDGTICKKEARNYDDDVFDEDGDIKLPTYTTVTVPDMTMSVYELYSPMDENFEYTTNFDYWIEYELTIKNSTVIHVEVKEFEKRVRTTVRLDKIYSNFDTDENFFIKEPPQSPTEKLIKKIFRYWREFVKKLPSSYSIERRVVNLFCKDVFK